MPKKATLEDFQNIENNQQQYNCNVCKDTGQTYFIVEIKWWGKKYAPTAIPQPCYQCNPKI